MAYSIIRYNCDRPEVLAAMLHFSLIHSQSAVGIRNWT